MRDELHLMELVDRYLDGAMDDAERAAFEERMRANTDLHGLVDDQRALREGMQRVQLRGAVASAHRAWVLKRWVPWAAAGLVVIAAAVVLVRSGTEAFVTEEVEHLSPTHDLAEVETPDSAATDSMFTELELETRVETIFMQARKPSTNWVDTCTTEGRIITHRITRMEGDAYPDTVTTSEMVSAVHGTDVVDEPFMNGTDRIGVNYQLSSLTRADSMIASQPDAPAQHLYTVKTFANATNPVFPGGKDEYLRFLAENLKQPRGSRKSGTVIVACVVNKKGQVVSVEVEQSLGRAFDAEAMRIVGLMPEWAPSRMGDRPVRSWLKLLIRFDGKRSLPVADRPANAR